MWQEKETRTASEILRAVPKKKPDARAGQSADSCYTALQGGGSTGWGRPVVIMGWFSPEDAGSFCDLLPIAPWHTTLSHMPI